MLTLNPIEWLALQRTSFSKPSLTWKKIREGFFSKTDLDLIQGKKDWELLQKLGLQMTPFESETYPKILKEIYLNEKGNKIYGNRYVQNIIRDR